MSSIGSATGLIRHFSKSEWSSRIRWFWICPVTHHLYMSLTGCIEEFWRQINANKIQKRYIVFPLFVDLQNCSIILHFVKNSGTRWILQESFILGALKSYLNTKFSNLFFILQNDIKIQNVSILFWWMQNASQNAECPVAYGLVFFTQ